MTEFPASHKDLLDAEVATLATLGSDGFPQVSEVWFLHDDGELKTSLNDSRLKTKNLKARPQCNVLILDLGNPYRFLSVKGNARIEPDPDYEFAEKLGGQVRRSGPARARRTGGEPRGRDDRAGERLAGRHARRVVQACR